MFSYARSNDKLKRLAREAQGNARAGTPAEVTTDADALLLAVHWSRIDDALEEAGDLSGKVILTCSLPMDAGNTKLIIGTATSGAEQLAKKVPRALVVCASNTVPNEVLFRVFEARDKKPRPPRRRFRGGRCRPVTNRMIRGAVRVARRRTRVRRRGWPRTRVSL